jgi:hypothetical protein
MKCLRVAFLKRWNWHMNLFESLDSYGDTDNSDAYVCEGWDETNYISADHGYYPDVLRWQPDPENASDEEQAMDE